MSKDKKKGSGKKGNDKPHFRRGKQVNKGHPSYIYEKVGNKYKFIGITHSEVTRGMKNIELENDPNPNPKERKKSYIRPKPDEAEINRFGGRLEGWRFVGDKDKKVVEEVIKKGERLPSVGKFPGSVSRKSQRKRNERKKRK
jgi:hypothetical protein